MKRVIAACLPLALAGCGLPPAITVISYAIDGFSLFSTGKTVGDHALSVAAKRDCAIWRVVKDGEVCRDFKQGDKSTLVAAAEEWERGPEIIGLAESDQAPTPTIQRTAVDPVIVPAFMKGMIMDLDGIIEAEKPLEIRPVAFALRISVPVGMAADAPLRKAPAAKQPPSPETTATPPKADAAKPGSGPVTAKKADTGAPAPEMVTRKSVVSKPAVEKKAEKPRVAAIPRAPEKEAAAAKPDSIGPRNVVVIRSFLKRSNAVIAARRWSKHSPTVVSSVVGRKVVYRVVTGPFAARNFATAVKRLKSDGIGDAWGAPVCGAGRAAGYKGCVKLDSGARK